MRDGGGLPSAAQRPRRITHVINVRIDAVFKIGLVKADTACCSDLAGADARSRGVD
jgi:hypothetical protein